MPDKVVGWSVMDVDMDEKNKTFYIKRAIARSELSSPALKPSFIFYTQQNATIMLNDKGCFLIRWKRSKYLAGKKVVTKSEKAGTSIPKLSRLKSKSPLARLAKKSMKMLFASGKVTTE